MTSISASNQATTGATTLVSHLLQPGSDFWHLGFSLVSEYQNLCGEAFDIVITQDELKCILEDELKDVLLNYWNPEKNPTTFTALTFFLGDADWDSIIEILLIDYLAEYGYSVKWQARKNSKAQLTSEF